MNYEPSSQAEELRTRVQDWSRSAVINAVHDALAPFGVELTRQPLSPAGLHAAMHPEA